MKGQTQDWITVNYCLAFPLAMLRKDLVRCAHQMIAEKQFLFQPGKHGSYHVPQDQQDQLLQEAQIAYEKIRATGGRFHQERVLPACQDMQSNPDKALKIYDKNKGETVRLSLFASLQHTPYTSHFDSTISATLLPYLAETDYQGSRTYDQIPYNQFRSKYARSLFVLFCGSGRKTESGKRIDEFHFKPETLRHLLQITDKYTNIAAFKNRLNQVQKEFANIGVAFTWEYARGKNNPRSKKLFTLKVDQGMLKYKPPRAKGKEKQDLFSSFPQHLTYFLMKELEITQDQVQSNVHTFLAYIDAYSESRFKDFIIQKKGDKNYKKRSKKHRIGWLIAAVKSEAEQEKKRQDKKNRQAGNLSVSDIQESLRKLFSNQKDSGNTPDSS